jgi:peroxiredoxin
MTGEKMTCKKLTIWFGLAVLAAAILIGCTKKPAQASSDSNNTSQQDPNDPNKTSPAASAKPADSPKPTLKQIIAKRRGWAPAYTNWYGKDAPDFNLTDLNGKTHTLSQYRGKNVMLIFWATWCKPCVSEIPHLIEIRDKIGEDKLAMLAISYNYSDPTTKVRKFVASNPIINYPVISTDSMVMPRPYNLIDSIPCSFFIDPEGKIKFATEGAISGTQMMQILEAER